MFIAELFIPAKTGKQSTCQLTEEWTKKMSFHIHNRILLSHKKNEIMPFAATWIDLEINILNEVSQEEKDKCHMILMWNLITYYMWNLKYNIHELMYEAETDSQT